MRPLIILIAAGLSACSMQPVTLSGQTEPFPTDYLAVVGQYMGDGDETGILVSKPRRMTSWSLFGATGWYVCLRQPGHADTILALFGGKISGVIANPDHTFCDGGEFGPLVAS